MHIFVYLVNKVYVYYSTYWICSVDQLNHEFKLNNVQKYIAYVTESRNSLN